MVDITQFELSELRYFRNVATTLSFARGAAVSHISPPAISKAIKKLEETLGVALFHRTTRSVVLTEAGQILLTYTDKLLANLDDCLAELSGMGDGVRGKLRIGAMEVFTSFALPHALTQLVQQYPGLEPQTYMMSPEQMERHLLEGNLDLGLCVGGANTEHVESHALITSPGSLVCGATHPLFEAARVTADDVAHHPFVVVQFFGREYLPALDQFPEDRLPRRVAATVELLQMGVQMVMDGNYLGYFPDVAIRCQLNHAELRRLEGLEPGPGFQLRALTHPSRPTRAGVAMLIEELRLSLQTALTLECAT